MHYIFFLSPDEGLQAESTRAYILFYNYVIALLGWLSRQYIICKNLEKIENQKTPIFLLALSVRHGASSSRNIYIYIK